MASRYSSNYSCYYARTAYKVCFIPSDPPVGKSLSLTLTRPARATSGACAVSSTLKYIEWVGETFGAEYGERYESEYTRRRLSFKTGMASTRSNKFELSRALLYILEETPGVTVYGITDRKQL